MTARHRIQSLDSRARPKSLSAAWIVESADSPRAIFERSVERAIKKIEEIFAKEPHNQNSK